VSGAALAPVLAHPVVARLAASLGERPGEQLALSDPLRRAAVALILRLGEAGALEFLLIRRAEYAGDPWSGQVALPGGRREPADASLAETAIRETREETGIDLAAHGRLLGRLDELQPSNPVLPAIAIAPYVAVLAGAAVTTLSAEVSGSFWVPLAALREARSWSEVTIEIRGMRREFPGFLYEGNVVWGLTERILTQFLRRIDPAWGSPSRA